MLVSEEDPFSPFAALRAVKVAIDINQSHSKANVISTISAFPGEGKTTASANLAKILGTAGGRTLLIDGDLGNPSLTRAFAKEGWPGLLEAMRENREY